MTKLESEYWASRLQARADYKDRDESSLGIKLLLVAATETLSVPQEDQMLIILRDSTWCQANWVKPYRAAELFLNYSVWKQTLFQVILVIIRLWTLEVKYCKEVFVRET